MRTVLRCDVCTREVGVLVDADPRVLEVLSVPIRCRECDRLSGRADQ